MGRNPPSTQCDIVAAPTSLRKCQFTSSTEKASSGCHSEKCALGHGNITLVHGPFQTLCPCGDDLIPPPHHLWFVVQPPFSGTCFHCIFTQEKSPLPTAVLTEYRKQPSAQWLTLSPTTQASVGAHGSPHY